MLFEFDGWSQGWILTLTSSLLCVLGCSVIFLDDIYYLLVPKFITSRYQFHLQENYTLLNGSLAFSSGCLLFTSLYRLLPAALKYIKSSVPDDTKATSGSDRRNNIDLMVSYIFGVVICVSFNGLLHVLTSESVVHCNHGGHDTDVPRAKSINDDYGSTRTLSSENAANGHAHEHSHGHSHQHSAPMPHSHQHSHSHSAEDEQQDEQLDEHQDEHAPLNGAKISRKKSLLHYIIPVKEDSIGECKGYSSAELCLHNTPDGAKLHYCEIPALPAHTGNGTEPELSPVSSPEASHSSHPHSHHHGHADHSMHFQDHHHHVNSPVSRLLLIGIQTTLAITLHKLPEGFITYITSEANPELGVSIFLSLLFHNFTEGFSMCLPLYYSFSSSASKRYAKLKALSISALLGGMAQPLGAFLGLLFLRANNAHAGDEIIGLDRLNWVFGVTMAVTAGFLSVIGLSMYGSAVSFGGSSNFVLLWCVAGMSVIGLSSVVSVHD